MSVALVIKMFSVGVVLVIWAWFSVLGVVKYNLCFKMSWKTFKFFEYEEVKDPETNEPLSKLKVRERWREEESQHSNFLQTRTWGSLAVHVGVAS